MLAGEIWRPVTIPGYETYQVSNIGRVRGPRGNPLLLQWRCGTGGAYRAAHMKPAGQRQKLVAVHVLAYTAFYGPPPPGHLIHHHDRNKANNALGNFRTETFGHHMALHNVFALAAAGRTAAAAARRAATCVG
jgi:hypothetical protein